jgi:shikimate dehydrogenase
MIWRLGVAGYPIEHSLSPRLHEVGLRLAGLEGTSERLALKQDQIAHLRALLGTSFDALSVTMPLKSAAVALCAQLDEVAARTGVVNSLLVRDGVVHGACTDGRGFVDSLAGVFGANVRNMHAVVLGAGGAARGIVDALVEGNVGSVFVYARNQAKVEELASHYASVHGSMQQSRPVDLIVNTIPVAGRVAEAAVMQGVTADTLAIDITYKPRTSAWLELHEHAGCRSGNGLAMLAYQAALQMQWWWNVPIDAAKLLEAVQ